MKTIVIIILTVLVIASFIAMTYITLYNKLMFSKIRRDKAEDVILDELENRYNLIMKSKKTIEKNTKMDLSIFSEVEKEKKKNTPPQKFDKILTNAIATIYIIKNDYPKIEEKKDFKEILRKLNESDTRIDAAKSFYNKNNNDLISLLSKINAKIIGKIKHIEAKEMYDSKEIFNEVDDGIKI